MDIKRIRTFIHVAELRSFTRASAALSVSQPALSRQIRLLEEELGVKLFHRDGHGVELTQEAMALLDRGRTLLSDFEKFKHDFRTLGKDAAITGSVSLGLPVPATRFLRSTFISDFNSHYSGIALRIVEGFSGLMHEWLMSGSLDLAVLYGPRQSKVLASQPILTEPLYAIAAATHGNRTRASIDIAELVRRPLILPSRPHVLRDLIDRLHLADVSYLEVDAISMMIELAQKGMGYSILPRRAVDAAVLAGEVVAIAIDEPNLAWEVSICHSSVRPLSAAAELLLRLIHNELRARLAIESAARPGVAANYGRNEAYAAPAAPGRAARSR